MKPLLFLFLPFLAAAQNTSVSVSDSIHLALVALANDTLVNTNDTLIQPIESFYSGSTIYVYLAQVAGGQFKGISHSAEPNIFKFNDPALVKTWHVYEIDNWLSGYTGTNYGGFVFSGVGTITCTLTVSGDTWTGIATNETDAFGRAFYSFLFDPDFETYLQ